MSQFHHEEGSLSILESRCPGDSTDEYLRKIPDSVCVLRSLQPLDSFTPNRLGTQYSTSQASTDPEPLEYWGIYVERGWDPWITMAMGPFNIYLVALEARLAAMALQYFKMAHDSTSCSLLLMFSDYLVFLLPMHAALKTRHDVRIRPEDFWMAFAWVRAFVVEHMLKRKKLVVLLLCMLPWVFIKYRTLANFVASMVFLICINGAFCSVFAAVDFDLQGSHMMPSSNDLELLFWPLSQALLMVLVARCSPLILRTVDSLIQARTNISPIGMLSQTAKHTITTINTIFGEKWLILIGISLYICHTLAVDQNDCHTLAVYQNDVVVLRIHEMRTLCVLLQLFYHQFFDEVQSRPELDELRAEEIWKVAKASIQKRRQALPKIAKGIKGQGWAFLLCKMIMVYLIIAKTRA